MQLESRAAARASSRLLGGPAERHASRDRGRRADAAAGRRARDGLGRGLGDHRADLRLHEPHAAGRGAGDVAGRAVRRSCCRAISRSSTRSTSGSSTGVRQRVPGDDDLIRRLSLIDDRDGGFVRMAHLASVGSHAINGVAALHSDLLKQTVLRDFYTVSPGEVHQRHQRRHSAAVDRAEQPRAGGARHPRDRRRLAVGSRVAAAAPRAVRRRSGIPGRVAGGQGGQQAPAGRR